MNRGSARPAACRRARRRQRTQRALAASLLAVSVAGCGGFVGEPVPPQLRGVWTTDAPAYAGRALKLTHSVVVFDAGPLGYDVHSVLEVESHDVGGGATAYTVYYRASEGFEDKFVFTYRPEPHPMLRLSHRDEIWTRSNASIGS